MIGQHKKIARSTEDVSHCDRGSVQGTQSNASPRRRQNLIKELHELARDILTSQDFFSIPKLSCENINPSAHFAGLLQDCRPFDQRRSC